MLLVEVVLTQLMVRALLRVCIFDTDNYRHYVIAEGFIYLLLMLLSLSHKLHVFYTDCLIIPILTVMVSLFIFSLPFFPIIDEMIETAAVRRLDELVRSHDICFALTDSREAR